MDMQEFEQELPKYTFCDRCGALLSGISWSMNRYEPGEWYGLGVAKCEPCSNFRIAAAGSNDSAHRYARQRRLDFLQHLNT